MANKLNNCTVEQAAAACLLGVLSFQASCIILAAQVMCLKCMFGRTRDPLFWSRLSKTQFKIPIMLHRSFKIPNL